MWSRINASARSPSPEMMASANVSWAWKILARPPRSVDHAANPCHVDVLKGVGERIQHAVAARPADDVVEDGAGQPFSGVGTLPDSRPRARKPLRAIATAACS